MSIAPLTLAPISPPPPLLHYAGMMIACLIPLTNPRPAALYILRFSRTRLLVLEHVPLLKGSILQEPLATLSHAKFFTAFFLSPFFTSWFLGSLSKAALSIIWRPHFTWQCFFHMLLFIMDLKSPLCSLTPDISAYWLPLRCPQNLFIFSILFFNFHTYYNEQFLSPNPPRSLGLSPRGFAVFSLHGPGVCHVCWVPPLPSYEGLFLCHWRSGIFCTADARGRAAE